MYQKKNHKLGDPNNRRPTALEAGSPRPGASRLDAWLRALCLSYRRLPSLCVLIWWRLLTDFYFSMLLTYHHETDFSSLLQKSPVVPYQVQYKNSKFYFLHFMLKALCNLLLETYLPPHMSIIRMGFKLVTS